MRAPALSFSLVLLSSCDGCADRLGECGSDRVHMLKSTYDQGDDGTLDGSVTYTWDDDGNLLSEESRGNGHELVTYSYDDDGDLVEIEDDDGADGVVDNRSTNEWDADGNLVTQIADWGADGQWDTRWEHTYDHRGNRTEEELWISSDSSFYARWTYDYDSHDNMTEACSSDSCETWTYTYDDDGNVLTMCYESGGCNTYEYKRGDLVSMVYEDDWTLTSYVYDDCEHVLSSDSHTEQDWNADGVPDYVMDETWEYTYDDQGNVLTMLGESSMTVDGNFDGVADAEESSSSSTSYTYTYD